MAIDDKIRTPTGIHPLLSAKLKMDEEERKRDGLVYRLTYEKTYAGGNTDTYDSSVKARNDEEAVQYAREKLYLKDALATWSTNITDAYLISPSSNQILVPPFSKESSEK